MKRRSFLRGLAAAPLGAQVAAQEVAMKAAGITGIGMAQLGSGSGCAPVSDGGRQFTTFASWLTDVGMRQIKQEAQDVRSLDPDIVCLGSVSLCAKIQMQRDRNLKRAIEDRKDWFSRTLDRHGHVSWWGD